MFTVESYSAAVVLCLVTMICWGYCANIRGTSRARGGRSSSSTGTMQLAC